MSANITQKEFIEMAAGGTGIEIKDVRTRRDVYIIDTIGVPSMSDVADFAELLGAFVHPMSVEFLWGIQDSTGMTMAFRLVVIPPALNVN